MLEMEKTWEPESDMDSKPRNIGIAVRSDGGIVLVVVLGRQRVLWIAL